MAGLHNIPLKMTVLAEEVENLCHQYTEATKLGKPNILSKKEMNDVLKKIRDYKN